jgi:hypothetical protein
VRCVFIALVESNRADASTISAALSARLNWIRARVTDALPDHLFQVFFFLQAIDFNPREVASRHHA